MRSGGQRRRDDGRREEEGGTHFLGLLAADYLARQRWRENGVRYKEDVGPVGEVERWRRLGFIVSTRRRLACLDLRRTAAR